MELQEIKRGETGRGILIENDGYLSLECGNNGSIRTIKEGIENGTMECPNPLIVDAVFQKYGIKNANGRIYPESILRREVEKYIQNNVAENYALGECYTPSAMVLTKDGWKIISHVREGDEVVTLNTENGMVEYQAVTYVTNYLYEGEIVRLKGEDIDDEVTQNHSFPIYDENGEFYAFKTAAALNARIVEGQSNKFIPKMVIEDEDVILFNLDENGGRYDADMAFISLDKNATEISLEPYSGHVYCIEVPNHVFYVRQNGKSHWTKNCNHPSETTIDLGRISHNIVELHWEGSTLVGKLKFNLTPGYCKYGIVSTQGDNCANLLMNGFKIGVSSRGVGSVEKKFGEMVVGDDFEIVCWDIVATPSTPGAFIGMDRGELNQYVESKDAPKRKSRINEKMERLKNIL